MGKTYKVLVVDDASFMRKAIIDILAQDPEIEVVGAARNGQECLEMIKDLRPDVITLDMDMPIMDGLSAIRHIMIECPVPVMVLSSLYANGTVTFEAMRLGVVDFVPKPSGAISEDIHEAGKAIIDRLKIATQVNMANVRRVKLRGHDVQNALRERYGSQPLEYLIAIGTSLGGPNTLLRMIGYMSISLPAALVVVLEMDVKIIEAFAAKFGAQVPWRVRPAKDGLIIEQGSCYIHSNRSALEIDVNADGEPCLSIRAETDRPLDRLLSSAADVFRNHAVGVLLTGIGDDGAEGFGRIREQGGITLAQNACTCVYPNLTDNAIKRKVVDKIVDEVFLSREIESLIKR